MGVTLQSVPINLKHNKDSQFTDREITNRFFLPLTKLSFYPSFLRSYQDNKEVPIFKKRSQHAREKLKW